MIQMNLLLDASAMIQMLPLRDGDMIRMNLHPENVMTLMPLRLEEDMIQMLHLREEDMIQMPLRPEEDMILMLHRPEEEMILTLMPPHPDVKKSKIQILTLRRQERELKTIMTPTCLHRGKVGQIPMPRLQG